MAKACPLSLFNPPIPTPHRRRPVPRSPLDIRAAGLLFDEAQLLDSEAGAQQASTRTLG